jgi:NB-ARC domain
MDMVNLLVRVQCIGSRPSQEGVVDAWQRRHLVAGMTAVMFHVLMQSREGGRQVTFEELKGLIQREMGGGSKRLLILDDVWDVDLLRTLNVLQVSGASGCMVTTRRGDLDWDVMQVQLAVPLPCRAVTPFAEAMLASYMHRDPDNETIPSGVKVRLGGFASLQVLCCICTAPGAS